MKFFDQKFRYLIKKQVVQCPEILGQVRLGQVRLGQDRIGQVSKCIEILQLVNVPQLARQMTPLYLCQTCKRMCFHKIQILHSECYVQNLGKGCFLDNTNFVISGLSLELSLLKKKFTLQDCFFPFGVKVYGVSSVYH